MTFERLLARDLDFVARNPSTRAPVDFAALILIIQREISVLLKNANLAHLLGTDAARGNVRDAAILETQPCVRDVFTAAQDRHAHGIDALHGRAHQVQNNFEIVDH